MTFFKKKHDKLGFTLTETIVTLAVFGLISTVIFSVHTFQQRAYTSGEAKAEITQNGRVILERIAREVRQAREIITELGDDESGATSTIMFEDGHDITSIQYVRYFKDDSDVKREKIAYYFSGDPTKYVAWNATLPEGQEKLSTTTEASQVIGEYVNSLKFWGSPVINISLNLLKADQEVNLKTKISPRNL